VPIESQILVILESVLLGTGLGLVYDVLRALRWHYRLRRAGTAVCDMLFWLTALAAFFRFGVDPAVGQNRFYVLAGLGVGAGSYAFLLSRAVLDTLQALLSFLSFIYKTIVKAILWTKNRVRDLRIKEKVSGKIKKVWSTPFHFWLKRYKIKDKSVSLRRRQREWRR